MTPSAPTPGPPASPWKAHAPLLLILAARLALGLAYSQVTPVWEAYDEDGHFAYARYLAVHRVFLLRTDDPETDDIWEKFQPPLYYNLIAWAIGGYDLGERFAERQTNPHFVSGDAGVNYALHPPQLSDDQASLTAAARTARAVSAVFSSISIIFVYLAARRFWPAAPSAVWAATALVAFWPQYLFMGSMISNDGLVTALSAAGIWLAVALADGGFRLRLALPLALVVGAAMLTKLNGAALAPLAAAALLFSLMRRPAAGGRRISPVAAGVGLAGLAALTVGALAALNSLEFVTGQIFRASVVRDLLHNLGPETEFSAGGLVSAALPYGFNTFLASFGWGNLEAWPWLYGLWAFGAAAGALGLLVVLPARWLLHRQPNPDVPSARLLLLMALLIVTLLALTLALAIAEQNVYLVPGRYLLPTLPAVVFLLVAGWRAWLPGAPARRLGMQAAALLFVLAGWAIPWAIIMPAYARPPALAGSSEDIAHPLPVRFGDAIELLGHQPIERSRAGEKLSLDLCWRAVSPPAANYSIFIDVVGLDGQGYGRLETYPGRGNHATTHWIVGEAFCDRYQLDIRADIPAPVLAQVQVGLHDLAAGVFLPAAPQANAVMAGDQAERVVLRAPVSAANDDEPPPPASVAVDYRFGTSIQLTGYDMAQDGDTLRLTLLWHALADVDNDYIVFVHLRDTPLTAYALGDSAPRGGAYPTSFWRAGEWVTDEHRIDLPPSNGQPRPPLELYVGLHRPGDEERLPAFDSDGARQEHDEVILIGRLELR